LTDATLAQLASLLLTYATCLQNTAHPENTANPENAALPQDTLAVGDGSAAGSPAAENTFRARLAELARQDSNFAEWCSSLVDAETASLDDAETTGIGVHPSPELPSMEVLLRSVLEWHPDSHLALLAKQAASAASRLRSLQSRYTADLEHSKREAIYQLAYGLSHELNNPLANITARAGVLLRSIEPPDQRLLLEMIVESASRGSEMLGDLMLMARPPQLQISGVDLREFGRDVHAKGSYWAGHQRVLFELDWRPTQTALLDPSLLNEIIWAILRNAIEASPAGGTVRLVAGWLDKMLQIIVEDQGKGLSELALGHCFDPFFSGREAGRGLGMGLAKAKRLAELHGGDVWIQNLAYGGCRAIAWIQASSIDEGNSPDI
jgi:signal transduction histidine kinase